MNREKKEDKLLKVNVLCSGRTSGRTCENFLRIYRHTNDYSGVEVIYVDPELNELQQRINKAIEYINDNVAVYAFNNKKLPHWEFNDDDMEGLLEILKGDSNE
jgi:hypothetical protein